MTELLRNASQGWVRMTDTGKLMALFLAALLFLWTGCQREEHKRLLRYGTAMAICCILPVTAAVLMLYQTRFYDYEWIWSTVPVTVMIAYAGTKALAESWQGFRIEAWRKGLPVTAGLLAVIFLSSGLGGRNFDREIIKQQKAEAESLLEAVDTEEGTVCLWAPREIMAYARSLDSSIQLPYGRNMWEEALGAYSYDIYSKEAEELYRWMCIVEETCTGEGSDEAEGLQETAGEQKPSTEECLETARQAGVNLLVLPENTNDMLLNEVISFTGKQPEQSSGYYLFQL